MPKCMVQQSHTHSKHTPNPILAALPILPIVPILLYPPRVAWTPGFAPEATSADRIQLVNLRLICFSSDSHLILFSPGFDR
jgi:hypothetical protein